MPVAGPHAKLLRLNLLYMLPALHRTALCSSPENTAASHFQALAKHEILSAPMVVAPDLEEIGDGNTSPSLLGWIDIADILRAFLQCEWAV